MSQIPAMRDYLPGIYMHHEIVNGAGYSQGLKGAEIPLQAKRILRLKICAVALKISFKIKPQYFFSKTKLQNRDDNDGRSRD